MKIAYVRNIETREPYGCIVKTDSGYGYSVCNPHDRFNKARAREIAVGRAEKRGFTQEEIISRVPSDLKDAFETVFDISFNQENSSEYDGRYIMLDDCVESPLTTREPVSVEKGFLSKLLRPFTKT
jgi:hypothetical protein